MLGSDHDGEIIAASRAAAKLVKAAGVTWFDVVKPPPEVRIVEVQVEAQVNEREIAADILRSGVTLNAKEAEFVRDMLARARFTPGQTRWLKMIAVKAGVL